MEKIEIECQSCDGTGLYRGMCEDGKCAVVCGKCNGTGKTEFHYEPFKRRKIKPNVLRVFKSSFGYGHSDKNTNSIEFSRGGCTYDEWLKGEQPKPVKDLYCPYMWNGQKYTLDKCKKLVFGDRISDCHEWNNKAKCWSEYEMKNMKNACKYQIINEVK